MPVYDAIKEFLRTPGIEGPAALVGYIPCRPCNYKGNDIPNKYTAFGVSGVTVATGFDLGQKTISELKNDLHFPPELIGKMEPYIGKKGRAAINALHNNMLRLSAVEVNLIDDRFIPFYYQRYVEPTYNRDSKLDFRSIPERAQVVVYSILYQRGPGYVKRMPNCWGHFTDGDFAAAAHELEHGEWPDYRSRRRQEGAYLRAKGQ